MDNPRKIKCISYASNIFKNRKITFSKQANECGLFDSFYCYDENDIDDGFKNKIGEIWNHPRGGGWWIWKPYLIWKELQMLNENDILVYIDSGCTLNVSTQDAINRFHEYISMTTQSSCGMLRFQLTHKEGHFSNNYLFQYYKKIFTHYDIDKMKNTMMLIGGIIILRKTKFTMDFFDIMMYILNDDAKLFTEYYSKNGEQHRHDQSIMSILYKLMGGDLILDDETYFENGDFSTIHASKFPIWATRRTK